MVYNFSHRDKEISLELHDYGSIGPMYVGPSKTFYEIEFLEYLRETYPKHKTIVDAGAHCGNHVVYYANFLEHTEIHAFEPMGESRNLLERNVAPYPSIVVHPQALSQNEGSAFMVRFAPEPGCTLFRSGVADTGHPDQDVKVPCLPLDSFGLKDVTLIKLDMEGAEYSALLGAEQTIRRDLPLLFIELSPEENQWNNPKDNSKVMKFLRGLGYKKGRQWYNHIMYEFIPPRPSRFKAVEKVEDQ